MKISQILRETKIHKITGDLIRFKRDKNFKDTEELEGKCALGVLACESPDKNIHLSKNKPFKPFREIIESYGLDNERLYPFLGNPLNLRYKYTWSWEDHQALSDIIIQLNDGYKLNFKEIAEFLEVTFDL